MSSALDPNVRPTRTHNSKNPSTKSVLEKMTQFPTSARALGQLRKHEKNVGATVAGEEDGDADTDDEGDDDTTNTKQPRRQAEGVSYDNLDDNKEEISHPAQASDSESEGEDQMGGGLGTNTSMQEDINRTD